jgi:hypothetical protein
MDLPADPGLSLVVYGTEPGSASHDALKLLASWTAGTDQEAAAARDAAGTREATTKAADVRRRTTNTPDGAAP